MLIASQDETVTLPYERTGFEIAKHSPEESPEVYVIYGLFNEHKYNMAEYPCQKDAVKQIKAIAEASADKRNCVYIKFS